MACTTPRPDIPTPARSRTGRSTLGLVACTLLVASVVTPARADIFQRVTFDGTSDEIVIVVAYRGTNPDHQFDLKWDACRTLDDGSHVIAGELLDHQAQDAARKDYKKTLRFRVAGIDCRPVTATIRTAPRFYATLVIPARAAGRGSPTTGVTPSGNR